ncbi:MAG: class I SAM-dependent methyltransferase [Chloroflexota bacterium]
MDCPRVSLSLAVAPCGEPRQKAAEAGVSLVDCVQGNALDLSRYGDGSFDVVLLMGPLYHLLQPESRDQAMREALRVLRPGGLLFAAFITRYAVLINMLGYAPEDIVRRRAVCEAIIRDGVDIPATDDSGFTEACFTVATDIEPFMAKHGLETLRLAGAEGIVAGAEPVVCRLPDEQFATWADLCYSLGTDPLTWGASEHMLYIGRKP